MTEYTEFFSDFSLGFLDGITVSASISSGLFASQTSKELIIKTIIIQTIAGMSSMGLSNYLSVDSSIEIRKDNAVQSGLTTSFGYFIGSMISFIAFTMSSTVEDGFKNSLICNFIALCIFGYIRGDSLKHQNNIDDIIKVLIIGMASIGITYYASSHF